MNRMADTSSDTSRLLYGVFFHYDGKVDENEVKKEFYSYGYVHSVRQVLSRVFVNFLSKEAAEECLQGRHEKYGEISKGRFGPKEPKDCDSSSVSSKGCPRRSCAPEKKSPNKASLHDKDDLGENCKTNLSSSSSSRNVEHSKKKNSPGKLKSKQNHLKKSASKEENSLSAMVYATLRSSPSECSVINSRQYKQWRTPNDEGDEPPELLSVHHHPRSSTNIYEDSEGPPALVSTSVNAAISPNSLSRVSASSRRSQDEPPELLSIHHHPRSSTNNYEDSEGPPALASTSLNAAISPNSLSRVSASSRTLQTNDFHKHKFQNGIDGFTDNVCDDIPPLIPTAPHHNGLQVLNDETHDSFSSYYKQVLIANVPSDITQNEVEKILYPLEPIYVSDLDVTNIRLKIGFVQVLFAYEEEANRAARQFDGLTLRGHYLSVKKVIDLVSMK